VHVPDELNDLVVAIADEIMAYLQQHTSAGDTVSGIRTWWLSSLGSVAEFSAVERAIERVVEAGALSVHVLPTGERFYAATGKRGKTGA
jgi:hypothetical protein